MKRWCYPLLTVACLPLGLAMVSSAAEKPAIEPDWSTFYGFDGSFSVQAPGLPTIAHVHTDAGIQVIYRFETNDQAWMISVVDPKRRISVERSEEFLRQAANDEAASIEGTLDSHELQQILGHPGVHFRVSNKTSYVHGLIILTGQRTFAAYRAGHGVSPAWDENDPVFRSFRLREIDLAGFQGERDYFIENGTEALFLRDLRYESKGMLREATTVRRVVLSAAFAQLGAKSEDTAQFACRLGRILAERHQYDEAVFYLEMALEIQNQVLGPLDEATISTHGTLGWVYRNMSAFDKSRAHIQKKLNAQRKVFGENSRQVAMTLYSSAKTALTLGQYAEALRLGQQSLTIIQALPVREEEDVAGIHELFGNCYRALGDHGKARLNLQTALNIYERMGAPILIALAKHDMGILDLVTGDYVSARKNISTALPIFLRLQGEHAINTLECRSDLANCLIALGDLDAAHKELLRVLEGRQQLFPGPNQMVAAVLSDLAILELDRGNPDKAVEYLDAAYQIDIQINPDEHPQLGVVLGNQGVIYLKLQQWQQAEQALTRSLDVLRQRIGSDHVQMLPPMLGLGQAEMEQQRFGQAEARFNAALELAERLLGADSPFVSLALRSLGQLYERRGKPVKAVHYLQRARLADTRFVRRQLSALSEQEQLRFLSTEFQPALQDSLSFSLRNRHLPEICRAAVEWLANAKATTAEVLTELSRLRKSAGSPQALGFVEQLASIRADMARNYLNLDKSEDAKISMTLQTLAEQEKQIIQELASQGVDVAQENQWVSFDDLEVSLPPKSALVDIFRVENPSPQSAAKYVAWIVKPDEAPTTVDLGEAEQIDRQINVLQVQMAKAVSDIIDVGEKEADERIRSALQAVSEPLLQPLLTVLADTTQVIICPDGMAWLVPWDALLLPDGRFAVEQFEIRLVLAGRDLLKTAGSLRFEGPPVIVADPDFGRPGPDRKLRAGGPPIVSRLRGTAREADAVRTSLTQLAGLPSIEMRGINAREERVKALQRPHSVLFSTHAFFLGGDEDTIGLDNPLLRCGLMLAGSNTGGVGGDEDGILTGIEVLGLDLRGTQFIVLSACDTGVGKIHTAEGVSGLRQAFQLAGANAVVASLWPASDAETAELMSNFYQQVAGGAGVVEGLRKAKLQLIRNRRRDFGAAHPVFWAAFGITGTVEQ